jgi:hypothetical protein
VRHITGKGVNEGLGFLLLGIQAYTHRRRYGNTDCYTQVTERGEKVKGKVSGGGSDVLHASQ